MCSRCGYCHDCDGHDDGPDEPHPYFYALEQKRQQAEFTPEERQHIRIVLGLINEGEGS